MIGQKPTHPLRLHHVAFISPPFDTICAAGIGRTAQADSETGVPAQTACRETYGLLLYAVRSLHPTIRCGRSHLPHGTNRTPRTSQRCDPEGTYAASRWNREGMAIDNIPNLAWLKTAPPLQKRRAAAVGKWHSACPKARLYRSKVDRKKTLPPAGKLCNPCLRASRRPHGRGKTVTVAKGWGLVANKSARW